MVTLLRPAELALTVGVSFVSVYTRALSVVFVDYWPQALRGL